MANKVVPADPWVLTCLDPSVEMPTLLWNGQIGFRVNRDATGFGPMFSINEYETKGEEKVRAVYNPLTVQPGQSFAIDASRPYEQSLDMRTGILTTKWGCADGSKVEVVTILLPDGESIGQEWNFQCRPNQEFSILADCTPIGLAPGAKDPKQADWSLDKSGTSISAWHSTDAIKPAWMFTRVGIRLNGFANPQGRFSFKRVLAFDTGASALAIAVARAEANQLPDAFPDTPESHWAYKDIAPPVDRFIELIATTKKQWAKRWQTDIEIDGPVEDQQAIHSFLFYLRSAIDPNAEMAISPYGLSSDLYNGHVFWDADTWVFPALALIDPDEAKTIPAYRLALRQAARRNFEEWLATGRPVYKGKLGIPAMSGEAWGYKFPWQSSVTGKETVRDPSRFEEHVTGDVAFMLDQAAALALVPDADARDVITGAANYYRERSSGQNIDRVMSSDEMDFVDNDLHTNLLAQWCVNGGTWKPSNAGTYKLPRDDTSFLTYDHDPHIDNKQAAAILSIYPLQYPPAEKEASVMMERFGEKILKGGPAMSDSLNALIWARLGESDKAYNAWEKSWRKFVTEPHLQFQERPGKGNTYFTTGAAGCLQSVLYGFLGFRIDSQKQDGALWSTDLALGRILSVKPNLPKLWKSVKLKNFTVMGRRYTLIATRDDSGKSRVQVTQGDR